MRIKRIGKSKKPADYWSQLKKKKAKAAAKRRSLGLRRPGGYSFWMREADKFFSIWARVRHKKQFGPGCPFSCSKFATVAFHVFPRGLLNIRFDQANIIGSCPGHNWHEKENRGRTDFYKNHFIRLRGLAEWKRLSKLAAEFKAAPAKFKMSAADLKAIAEDFKVRIERGDYEA